jgi:hypothetical protein
MIKFKNRINLYYRFNPLKARKYKKMIPIYRKNYHRKKYKIINKIIILNSKNQQKN